jgi:hypothetical protein
MDHEAVDDLYQTDELADDNIDTPRKNEDGVGNHAPVRNDKSTAHGDLTPSTTQNKIQSLRGSKVSAPFSGGRQDGIESTEDEDETGGEFTRLLYEIELYLARTRNDEEDGLDDGVCGGRRGKHGTRH